MVEHDMNLVRTVSDRVMALNYGRVLALGTPDEVQTRSRGDPRLYRRRGMMPASDPMLRRRQYRNLLRADPGDPRCQPEVPRGQIVTVLGANGAGKTTILRTISGIMSPERGEVRFEGEDIRRCRPTG